MIDFVIPNNNEKEFVLIAEKLGYSKLCFLYNFDDYINNPTQTNTKKIKIYSGILADPYNINRVNNKIKNKKIFVAIESCKFNREIIEKSKTNLIFSLEEGSNKDFIHQRGSGLDHIMCKLLKQNNIIVGFSLNSLLNSKIKHKILGRITQNIKLCRKYKVKTNICSFAQNPFEMRSPKDLISLFESLGMNQKTVRDSLTSLHISH